jgi:hypothetical protein
MRSDFDVLVGNRLRMARFRAKLTPAELAKMVGSDEALNPGKPAAA